MATGSSQGSFLAVRAGGVQAAKVGFAVTSKVKVTWHRITLGDSRRLDHLPVAHRSNDLLFVNP